MKIHDIQRHTSRKRKKLVGRGGKRGKTAGRGMKGQKARAGHKMRPELRDIIKKLPKHRGYKFSRTTAEAFPVNVESLEAVFANGETVTPVALAKRGLVSRRNGVVPPVKILGTGTLSKKLSVVGCVASATAKEKIEKAGGSITEQKPKA